MWWTFPSAFCAGFLVAAPTGPLTLMASRALFSNHVPIAYALGAGTVFAETLCAGLVTMGGIHLPILSSHLTPFIEAASGGLLLGAGLYMMWKERTLKKQKTPSRQSQNTPSFQPPIAKKSFLGSKALGSFTGSFLFTFLNPLTFASVITALNLIGTQTGKNCSTTFIIICFGLGGITWWLTLLGSLWKLGKKAEKRLLSTIHKACSFLIGTCGIYMLLHAWHHW